MKRLRVRKSCFGGFEIGLELLGGLLWLIGQVMLCDILMFYNK
jgi:hypothetical protein